MTSLMRLHRPLMVFTAAMAVLAVVAAVGIVADPRVLTGMPIWAKPFKFAVSFVLYATTLAWMLSLLPRRSRAAEWAATVVVAASVAEMVVIVGQVLRGRTSHFNQTTPFDAALWSVMSIAVIVLVSGHFVVGLVLLRARIADRVAAHAVRWGLGLSLLGMLVAVPMTLPSAAPPGQDAIAGAHSVGVADGGAGLPLLGWSTTGGDLRIGHFVGLHALQALPLVAMLLGRRFDGLTRRRLLAVAGGAYGSLTLLLTWQALRGQPLLQPDALTVTVAGALAAGTVLATGTVLRLRRPELELAA
ncbi:hypothetical protein AB0J80_05130 [Actinoplanes sp. NPDC049548]|uniref:hypothetical protein n=1 Tax=Actinoplanes sp. NPDC049548 TaxID=3155152 RepID=UPI0034176919